MRGLIVGEAYGEREARFNHGFVGASGKLIARFIGQAGLAPKLIETNASGQRIHLSELDMIAHWRKVREHADIGITNVFMAHPPANNLEAEFFTNKAEGCTDLPPLKPGKYLKPSARHHLDTLIDYVRETKPNLVIAAGNAACWALLRQTKISTIRGTLQVAPNLGVKVLPTYHPAAILRQWTLSPIVMADLTKAAREIEYPEVRRTERWIVVRPTLDEIAAWLDAPAERYSVDIETGRALFTKAELERMSPCAQGVLARQISMVGFARDKQNALVIPFMTRNNADLSYWADAKDEARAWRLVERGLRRSVPKIFQNGMFDIQVLLRHRMVPTMCHEDTMLLHHSIYPEMQKSLGFLGSIYANETAWKTMYAGGESLKRDD